MIYSCCNLNRKNAILSNPGVALNGIDFLELADPGSVVPVSLPQPTNPPQTSPPSFASPPQLTSPPQQTILPQQTLLVHCLRPVPSTLTPDNVLIEGGESITDISVTSVLPAAAPMQNVLVVQTNKAGDFSTYTLRLVNATTQAAENAFDLTEVLPGFDPQLAQVQFSFKVGCGPDFDCNPSNLNCPQTPPTPPVINYLAKDYGSFRTVILDRLNQLLPAWGGSTEADLGVILAELLAYRCDYLSYQQDAIATEAYIETARSRVSLRRHARLVDYHVHDGCNARTWIRLTVAAGPGEGVFLDSNLTRFYTYAPNMPTSLAVGAGNEEAALLSGVQVFQPMQEALLYEEHNQMLFYTWGDTECCLPQGAVEATLSGYFPNLQPGNVLIFQEVIGPQTGNPADADLRHRCAVRLTGVATQDANGNPLVDPLFDQNGNPISNPGTQNPAPVTEIQWSPADALPFPICISSTYVDSSGTKQALSNVSVVFGNVVLADHGLSISGIDLETVPEPWLFLPPHPAADRCQPTAPVPLPARFRPEIPDSPLTQAVPQPLASVPVTPNLVPFGETGSASLPDSNGFVSLMVQAVNPTAWPQFFGVVVRKNQTAPANIDLSVVYHPQGATGNLQITLERFTSLSFQFTDPNYVALQINTFSRLIRVPSSYVPLATAPSNYPTTPTVLTSTGTVNLQSVGSPPVTYLTLEVTPPADWPQSFAILTQEMESAASPANVEPTPGLSLAIVYFPSSGALGVTLPVTIQQVTIEELTPLALLNIGSQFNSPLVTLNSFVQAPDLSLAAYDLTNFDPSEAVPEITLDGTFDGTVTQWSPQQDLLGSGPSDQVFVVEVESDGTASLRFATPPDPGSESDDTNGLVPDSGTQFAAGYRIGNGTAGNVGAESLVYLAAADARIQSCTNPLPASGGTDPETNDQIRRRAPQSFLSQDPSSLERSVTMADYEAVVETNPQVDQAVASLRWTGSWYSVFIAVEPKGGGNLTSSLQASLTQTADRYRFAGQDLQLESPQYVSLQIELQICVDQTYFQSDVEQSLLQVLGNQILPDGQKGLFYPDNFTFGQTVYLSRVYAAARSIPGVISVTATQFQPQGLSSPQYLAAGEIKLGSLQVARLDNDPSYPDHGQLSLVMLGGK
jgi:hypothetical protein